VIRKVARLEQLTMKELNPICADRNIVYKLIG